MYLNKNGFFYRFITPGLLFLLLITASGEVFGATGWIQDKEAKFKINVPRNYQKNRMVEGSDIVHAFVSPDQNVAVRIRAIKLNKSVDVDSVINVFEQNIISGSQRLIKDNYTLNAIPGKICGYKWQYNNIPVGLAAFYTVRDNIAYVVWSIIPERIFKQRTAESDAIINTFTLLGTGTSGGLFGSMTQQPKVNKPHQGSQGHVAPSRTSSSKFFDLVSDDARITHKVPKGFELADKQTGQSIWKNDAGIKMVIQTIVNQGPFKSYMKGVIADIKNNGATIVNNTYTVENGLVVANYAYEYGDNYFAYGATQGDGMYYLVGFVGKSSQKNTLIDYSEEVNLSLKKVR